MENLLAFVSNIITKEIRDKCLQTLCDFLWKEAEHSKLKY